MTPNAQPGESGLFHFANSWSVLSAKDFPVAGLVVELEICCARPGLVAIARRRKLATVEISLINSYRRLQCSLISQAR
jgi:hypothetical protein